MALAPFAHGDTLDFSCRDEFIRLRAAQCEVTVYVLWTDPLRADWIVGGVFFWGIFGGRFDFHGCGRVVFLGCGLTREGRASGDSNFAGAVLARGRPVGLLEIVRADLEAAIQRGADLLWIKKRAPPDFVEGEEAVGLPLAESPKAGAGGFAGEDNLDAILCTDELGVVW